MKDESRFPTSLQPSVYQPEVMANRWRHRGAESRVREQRGRPVRRRKYLKHQTPIFGMMIEVFCRGARWCVHDCGDVDEKGARRAPLRNHCNVQL
jgi:hypothetical protein